MPTKETHVILTIRFNLTSAFLQLSRKHEKTTKPHAMCDSSKFSHHAHGARDSQHNVKLMSRNTISGRDNPQNIKFAGTYLYTLVDTEALESKPDCSK